MTSQRRQFRTSFFELFQNWDPTIEFPYTPSVVCPVLYLQTADSDACYGLEATDGNGACARHDSHRASDNGIFRGDAACSSPRGR
jgi:hypothetical protein